jgi:hypothetical protein
MLSHGRIAAPHFGQADAGITMDFRPGMRTMQTFRKLPMINPKRAANMPINVEGATIEFCHIARRPTQRPAAVVPDC